MVEFGCLAALDHLQWLRTGARAADRLDCHQSKISRDARKCQRIFGVTLIKKTCEWRMNGDDSLLSAERKIHQKYRWEQGLPLRLDGQHWMREDYEPLPLDGWIKGNFNYLEYEQPHFLLKKRIIDAWLCSAPDHPNDPDLAAIQLCTMPCQLTVKNDHPLVALGTSVTLDDVRPYPLLPLPDQSVPIFTSLLQSLGLNQPDRSIAQNSSLPLEDLVIGIASPLRSSRYGPEQVVLPIQLPITFGEVVMVPADFADHPRTRRLVRHLLEYLGSVSAGRVDSEIHAG